MFDPTAFDNLKVILEGIVYEHDLSGAILVIERNDLVNLADLSRRFNTIFVNRKDRRQLVEGKVELRASFRDLSSEWMSVASESGAWLSISYFIQRPMDEILERRIEKYVKKTFSFDFSFHWERIIDSNGKDQFRISLEKREPILEKTADQLPNLISNVMEGLEALYFMVKNP
jgi:hypothetical protein